MGRTTHPTSIPCTRLPGVARMSSPDRATCGAGARLAAPSSNAPCHAGPAFRCTGWAAFRSTTQPATSGCTPSASSTRSTSSHGVGLSLVWSSRSRRIGLGCASPRCPPHGETGPQARADSASGSGSRAICIGTGAEAVDDFANEAKTTDKMSRVTRVIYAVAISFLAFGPLTATATPTPSPGLDKVLVAPPTGYTELTSSSFHGSFTAHDYAVASDETQATEIEKTLNHDGFVDGYGKTWIHQTSQRAMVEAVIAFTGARGAKDWLTAAEAGDKSDANYGRADTITGINPYYGGHLKYSSSNTVGDVFSFVKGNDVFIVGVVSTKDDVLSLATTQTKTQFDQAPGQTIPSSQWPENASKNAAGSFPLLAVGIIGALIVVAVVAVLAVTMRRRGGMA